MDRYCELSRHAREKQLQTNENNKERGFDYILPLSQSKAWEKKNKEFLEKTRSQGKNDCLIN